MILALSLLAVLLAGIELIRGKMQSLICWAVLAIALAHLWPFLVNG